MLAAAAPAALAAHQAAQPPPPRLLPPLQPLLLLPLAAAAAARAVRDQTAGPAAAAAAAAAPPAAAGALPAAAAGPCLLQSARWGQWEEGQKQLRCKADNKLLGLCMCMCVLRTFVQLARSSHQSIARAPVLASLQAFSTQGSSKSKSRYDQSTAQRSIPSAPLPPGLPHLMRSRGSAA